MGRKMNETLQKYLSVVLVVVVSFSSVQIASGEVISWGKISLVSVELTVLPSHLTVHNN